MNGRRGCNFQRADEYDYDVDNFNETFTYPAKSSSGTSVSSCAQPTQRYPQTTTARRKLIDVATPTRNYLSEEPCLSKQSGPTPEQIASQFCSLPTSKRPVRSAGCMERPSSPRNSMNKPSRWPQEDCEPDMNQCGLKASSAKKQVAFNSSETSRCAGKYYLRSAGHSPPKSPKSGCHPSSNKTGPVPVSEMFDPEDQAALFGTCPNMELEDRVHCTFQEYSDQDESFLTKIMKKIRGPSNPCPLKVDFSNRKQRNYGALARRRSSCFSKKDAKDESLEQLDDLWNPDTFMRWKCIDNWDQHKESLWRSVIKAKLDCPESYNRCIEDMMFDAFKAMNAPGGECISFRMIYGILRRNEDMYLNPYIDHFTDSQFLKLIIALNRFFLEDKDKRKMFFDHPPPNFIEKIMMKETLGVLDPTSPSQTIARRFWDLLLDWYARKINEPDEETKNC